MWDSFFSLRDLLPSFYVDVLCQHSLDCFWHYFPSDHVWLVFPYLLIIYLVCFWHISTCWWCPVLPFRSSSSHLREAWCHSFYSFLRSSPSFVLHPYHWLYQVKMDFHYFFYLFDLPFLPLYSNSPLSCSIHSCHSKWPVVWHRVGHPWCHDSLLQPFLLFWRSTFYFSHLQDSGGCWSRFDHSLGASHSLIDIISWVKHYIYVYRCGPSPDPSIDVTHYFKSERESWFSSFEKFVPMRNGFVWSRHFLFLFLNGENLSKNKNLSMTPVRKKRSATTRF